MRKRTITKLFDNVLWYAIYMLPLLLMLLYWFKTGSISLVNTMTDAGLGIVTNNPIFDSLNSIFGASGTFPLFASADVICYMTYFISTFIIHLAVDFLLFIPRLAHKWMDCLGGKDE